MQQYFSPKGNDEYVHILQHLGGKISNFNCRHIVWENIHPDNDVEGKKTPKYHKYLCPRIDRHGTDSKGSDIQGFIEDTLLKVITKPLTQKYVDNIAKRQI